SEPEVVGSSLHQQGELTFQCNAGMCSNVRDGRQSERLEVKNILINENVRTFQLVDHFTELTIVSDLRDLELVEHELLARGRDHEECRQKQPRRELQKIRTDKLFHSSFSGGSHLPSSQGSGSDSPTGTSAVVSGVAGIGKTTLVQKIVHDWATGKIYPHFHFVFVFKFRDLNRFHDRTTLSRLIVEQYPYLSDVLDELWKHPETLLFIFDGLDEFRATIDFGDNQSDTDPQRSCTDPKFYFKVSDIVRSLIQQKLLPGCSVLVTSRPTATHLLAKAQVSVWAEILGFVGEERKEYFHKFFEDQGMAAAVYSHVEENELLLTMCYNPSYCWILALTLGPFFTLKQSNKHPVPKTVTQLFSHYIYHILTHHSVKIENLRDVILKIGNMAFTGVSHRNIIFNTEDLIKYDLQLSQFLSSFLMEIVERESSERSVVYTFPHLSIQEFAAALAQFLSPHPRTIRKCLARADRAKNGRFEIFLRFVAGLTSSRAAQPLEEFLGPLAHHTTSAVIDWLKEKFKAQIRDTDTVHGKRKLLNTLHYLFESQNQALVQLTLGSVQTLTFGGSSPKKALRLTPIDCVVVSQAMSLCIVLLHYIDCVSVSVSRLASNQLRDSGLKPLCDALRNPECKIQRLVGLWTNVLPGIKPRSLAGEASAVTTDNDPSVCYDSCYFPVSLISRLEDNKLTADCTEELASALKTNRSLTELHLSHNNVGDSGVKRLCEALRNPELWCNNLSDGCTNDLVSALSTSRSLRKLFLEYNSFTDISIPALRRLTLTCTSLEEIR
uniref:NACHT domain-containing protein n=1 Tax=Callorhinchus milii TaxID=7868 RepID=A0A4W3HX27_CALMI